MAVIDRLRPFAVYLMDAPIKKSAVRALWMQRQWDAER